MEIIIHRGTHQIGGIATEIRTNNTRIIIDMGDELSLDEDYVSENLSIPGVTDDIGTCDAVLFTHYHGDHTKQMDLVREGIPLYAGELTREILFVSESRLRDNAVRMNKNDDEITAMNRRISRIEGMNTFKQNCSFYIGDIKITPFTIDHSAIDAYMFLIEADGEKVVYTGDFRLHGPRGKGVIPMIQNHHLCDCDVLITEGTTLSRSDDYKPQSERDLQEVLKKEYIPNYKYVFVLASTTNFDRIFSAKNAVPHEKCFVCDDYQKQLMKLVDKYCAKYSSFYKANRVTGYGENLLDSFKNRGFVMMVRQNRQFERIIKKFDPSQSIILYSMWDGYRTKPGSDVQNFLDLAGTWENWHTSGHAFPEDIRKVVDEINPRTIIPIHTESPEKMKELYADRNVVILQDGEVYSLACGWSKGGVYL